MNVNNNLTIPIIILNWNGTEDTIECIEALEKQTYQNFIVFLVDNNSETDQRSKLKELYTNHPKVKLILNTENLGFSKGNNEVIKQLLKENYKYVVLLNNDTKVDTKWLESLVNTKADMVSSKMANYFNPKQMDNAGHIMLNTGEILPLGTREPSENYTQVMQNFGACAGAALYSTKMLKEIGIFDNYFKTGYEDAELGVRAVLTGYKSVYQPDAIVLHKGSVSINKVRDLEYGINVQKNIYYTFLKLMPWSLIILNLPFIILKIITISLIGLLTGRISLIKVQLGALKRIWNDWGIIKEKRKSVKRKLSAWEILTKQKFFLFTYFQYFNQFILQNRRSVIE